MKHWLALSAALFVLGATLVARGNMILAPWGGGAVAPAAKCSAVIASGSSSDHPKVASVLSTDHPITAGCTPGMSLPAGSCPSSVAFLARTSALGSTARNADDALICNLSNAGTWAKLDAFYWFATNGGGGAIGKDLNMVSASFPITANGSPNFANNDGYLGVEGSSTVYLDTGYNPATAPSPHFLLDGASFGIWIIGPNVQSVGYAIGGVTGTEGAQMNVRFTDNNTYTFINNITGPAAGGQSAVGSWVVTRTTHTLATLYHNGIFVANNTTDAAINVPSTVMYILAHNQGGPSLGAPYRVAGAFFGGALSQADAVSIRTQGCLALTAIGSSGAC